MQAYLKAIIEGGNISIKIGDKWVGAQKVDVQQYGREKVKTAIQNVMHAINKRIQFCDNDAIDSGKIFAGSGSSLFNERISDEEFLKYKPRLGDIDVQVDQDLKGELSKILKPGTIIGGAKYLGKAGKSAGVEGRSDQINTLFLLPLGDGVRAQFDFEFVEFDKETKEPSEWSTFSHSSSWQDTTHSIKGVLHKYLLRSIAGGKKVDIKLSTPSGTKIKDERMSELSFSVARGLRKKTVPLAEYFANPRIDENTKAKVLSNLSKITGKTEQQLKKEKNIFIELPTVSSEYLRDVHKIVQTIGIPYNKNDILSFVGLIELLKEVEDRIDIKTIFQNFVELLFEQETENPANYEGSEKEKMKAAGEADTAVKKAGLDYFMKEFPVLKSEISPINAKLAAWKRNYGKRYLRRK